MDDVFPVVLVDLAWDMKLSYVSSMPAMSKKVGCPRSDTEAVRMC